MAAASNFCSMSHGYGVKDLNKCLPSKHSVKRIHQVLSLPDVGQRPLCMKIYSNKTIIMRLHSIQRHYRILLKCTAEHTDSHIQEEKEEDISKAILIWRAIKLPMYTVALIPITVGSAAAYLQTGQYFGNRYLKLLVSSIFVMAWVNLSNDVYDFDTGADKNKKESVVNLVGSRTGTHFFAWLLLVLGFTGLSWVALEAQSIRSIFLLAWAIICGYIYQCPPFRLSYLGLGEPLCFAAFGPFATTAFLLASKWDKVVHSTCLIVIQEHKPVTDFCYDDRELSISGTVVASSILVGLTTSLILFCSHFHQVRLGTERGAKVVKLAVVALYSLLFILGLGQTLPFSSVVLCALTLPVGRLVASFVEKNHMDKTKIFMAKYYCVRLHTVFGAALAAGLVAARMFARRQLPHAIIL